MKTHVIWENVIVPREFELHKFYCTLIWYQIHTNKHTAQTGANRLTHLHKYMLTTPAMCSQQQSVLQWMNNLLISKIHFKEFHNLSAFQRLLICSLDSMRLSYSHATKKTLIKMVQISKARTSTPNTRKKITLERVT